jgi:hypothetical protein
MTWGNTETTHAPSRKTIKQLHFDTLWKHPCQRSILSYSSCCLNNSLLDELSLNKAQYILETSSLLGLLNLLAIKTTARVIARNETGLSINRYANFRWSPHAKTITDMRRRDCNLPLNKEVEFIFM